MASEKMREEFERFIDSRGLRRLCSGDDEQQGISLYWIIWKASRESPLMDAAADLLEALEALAEYVDRMHDLGHIQRPQQSCDALRAIAKARGELCQNQK